MLRRPVAIATRRQQASAEGTSTATRHSGASGGGTGHPHAGTPLPTTTATTHRPTAAILAEGEAVQGTLLAACRAGDTATAAAAHDLLNLLTKEYLAAAREEGEWE